VGNARPLVLFDILVKLLRYHYDTVMYVRNITDVDDKINQRAMENSTTINSLCEQTIADFQNDCIALNVAAPDVEPRATQHIAEMLEMISELVASGYAYEASGHVLFSVATMPEYGTLSGRSMDEMIAGARVEVAPYKKDPGDFVLWKPSDTTQPGWDSPYGRGRPGWHIECSAMARKYLGKEFDIHAGGLDLIFPHHENEIAQSCCAHNTKNMARYWVHNGYVTVNGEKMSKSAGNFTTVADALTKHRGEAIRYALMAAHYRAPLDYSDGQVSESKQALDRLYRAAGDAVATNPPSEFIDILNDDLNTPQALAFLHQKAKDTNKGDKNAAGEIKACAELLGLLNYSSEEWFRSEADMKDLSVAEIEQLIEERRMARLGKNFSVADEIRQRLASNGIELLDSADGTNWQKK
jgi:cysteinyl-tRNA synthetase